MCFHSLSRVCVIGTLVLVCLPVLAIDTSSEEKTCQQIGFKPKTERFASCVMELYGRRSGGETFGHTQRRPTTQNSIQAGTDVGSAEDQTCQNYGFRPGQEGYSNCRMQIDMAKRQGAEAQARYQQELVAYEAQTAELKRQQDRARARRQIEFGLRMIGGQPPVDALNSLGTGAPITRPAPPDLHHSIQLPNGRIINCSTFANHTNCN